MVNEMYAVIETGGKQYRVEEGSTIAVERLDLPVGAKLVLQPVMVVEEGKVKADARQLKNAQVKCRVLGHDRGEKITVFKYKPKKNYRVKRGHRQAFSRIVVEKIEI